MLPLLNTIKILALLVVVVVTQVLLLLPLVVVVAAFAFGGRWGCAHAHTFASANMM